VICVSDDSGGGVFEVSLSVTGGDERGRYTMDDEYESFQGFLSSKEDLYAMIACCRG